MEKNNITETKNNAFPKSSDAHTQAGANANRASSAERKSVERSGVRAGSPARFPASNLRPATTATPRPTSGERTVRTENSRPTSGERTVRTENVRPTSGERTVRTENVRSASGERPLKMENSRPTSGERTVRTENVRPTSGESPARTNTARPSPDRMRNAAALKNNSAAPARQARNAPRASGNDASSRKRKPKERKKGLFKKGFIIYVCVLVALSAVFLIYVHSLLTKFESGQIDNVLKTKLSDIQKAADGGNVEKELSLEQIKARYSPSDDEIRSYEKAISQGELTVKKSRSESTEKVDAYDVLLNGFRIGKLEAQTLREDMVLAIFPVTEWEIISCSADVFALELPSSVSVTSGGNKVEGRPSDKDGVTLFPVSALFSENAVITDSAGHSVEFNGKTPLTFVNYTAKVLSNYRVWSGDKMIDPAFAARSEIKDYKYVKEYCDALPDLMTYELCLFGSDEKLTVKDENGSDVEFTQDGTLIEAQTPVKHASLPDGLKGAPDPIKVAETWSLFMTRDLKGKHNGFDQLGQYLIKGSYLYEKTWQYATGIDMTFMSDHYLQNPPFTTEEADDFVKYSDECFSCHIKIDKPMRMTNGVWNTDTFDSIFYFVYIDDSDNSIDDPHWAVADRQ